MKLSGHTKQILAASIFAAASASSSAVTISEYAAGTQDLRNDFYNVGQSFTTGAATSYNNLEFDFTDLPALPGSAETGGRTLYLLSSAYTGNPNALSIATAGFIASKDSIPSSSLGAGDISWVFNPTVSVQGSTQYWVYTQNRPSSQYGSVGGTQYANVNGSLAGNGYSGGRAYSTSFGQNTFVAEPNVDINFRFTGTAAGIPTVTPVPEPSEWALMLTGLGLLGVVVQHRKKHAAAI